jgi:hypothetical protein
MLKPDGSMLHITSSASVEASNDPSKNEILCASKQLDFDRYEAEDAARQGSAVMRDGSMSNGAKARLGAEEIGRLTFHVHVAKDGPYTLTVNYEDIGFPATPRLVSNGRTAQGTAAEAKRDDTLAQLRTRDLGTRGKGNKMNYTATVHLKSGNNTIEVAGGEYALDVDYLEVTYAP